MPKREEFLRSVSHDKTKDFLNFISLHRDSADPFDLDEVLQELPKSQREELWEGLLRLLSDALVAFPIERWNAGIDDDSDDEMEVEVSPELKRTMAVMAGVTEVATASVAIIQEGDAYGSLLQCAGILNGILSSLPASEVPVQLGILQLCERWWQMELGPEIKRLWSIHEVLLSVDFKAEESKGIVDLLLQCYLSVAYIMREEGRRFLTFLFSWNVDFIHMIHGTIKNQLQYFAKVVTEHVAEIYFRAWKKASGVFLQEIETRCIQDLMEYGVLLHRNSPVRAKVRQILSYFHNQKLRQGVDEMLHRLYKPILWRSLKAPNFEVRANAAFLLAGAFPIHDPSVNGEKINEAIQKQLDILFSLLEDPQPLVRSTAVLGVCTVLARYWEMIPPTVLTDFLKKLVTELAADVSSADVRCSVSMCMAIILDNNLSHLLMEQLLPVLKNSLHDHSEKVRVAFVDLLLKIKAVRAAKFWNVCSIEHLLARLAIDSAPMNPMAARKFYQHAYAYTAPANIAKLMMTIRRCLDACIHATRDKDPDETDCNNKENVTVLEEDILTVQDTATMASLLEVVVILWRSIHRSLELNQDAFQYTVTKFAAVLPEYFRVFQDERCTAPLILIASFMPAAAIPTFSCGVLSKLRKLEDGAEESQYGTLIDCLCNWGQVGHILEVITDWLSDSLPQSTQGKKRRVSIQETSVAKPDLGLDYLEYLLIYTSKRDCLLAVKQSQLNHLLKSLSAWKTLLYAGMSSSEASVGQSQVETALRAFTFHGRLSAHLQHKFSEGRDYFLGLESSAAWIVERALPFMVTPDEGGVSQQQLALAKRVIESYLTVCRDVVMVGLADEEFKGQVLHLCLSVLKSEKGCLCMVPLLSVLKEVAEDCLARSAQRQSEQLAILLSIVCDVFQKVLETIMCRLRKDPKEGMQLCHAAVVVLGDFLNTIQDWKAIGSEAINGVFSTISAAIIVEIRHSLHKISCAEEVTTPESVQDLPPLSSCLLGVILKSPNVTRSFLTDLNASVDSGDIDSVTGLAAVLNILAVVRHMGKNKSELKSIVVSIQRQLQKHYPITGEDTGNVKRVIYESAIKTLNEMLML
ncbi:hypothetical protein MATL_G00034550 [Megalops atlanticus]|uniref:Condensin-2 complex subunit G2 n=1 Tax=Megalops atlanticus TaxID=7932 RepID=A0A9D3TGG4_MEGAT|nr:hypothetical protein MATL_G00034550 [Megalops atlanticus]